MARGQPPSLLQLRGGVAVVDPVHLVLAWKADPACHKLIEKWRRQARKLMKATDKVRRDIAVQAEIDDLNRSEEDDEGDEEGDEGDTSDDENEDGVSGFAPAPVEEGDGENEYLARRQENMRRNEAMFAELFGRRNVRCRRRGQRV
jgi:hypothetical protein